jgi:glycosyltransferase involved in cell wall biosynthesis
VKISIVIPTFNRLWALPRSVSQFYGNPLVGEILVINDCSTDGTHQWLDQEVQNNPALRVIHYPEKRGLTSARNLGIEAVQNEYFLFWDDDMLLMPSGGLKILFDELLRYEGDMISPGFVVSEGNFLPDPSTSENTQGDLVTSEVLVERRTLMLHRLMPDQLPGRTFQSPLIFGWTLQKRELYRDVRYAGDLAPTYFREETDVHLALLERNRRLLACPFVYALDMKRPAGQHDGGCHSHGTLLRYDLYACRNNWRMLRRRQQAVRKGLGIRHPIILLQIVFVVVLLLYRLPRRLAGILLRKAGLKR